MYSLTPDKYVAAIEDERHHKERQDSWFKLFVPGSIVGFSSFVGLLIETDIGATSEVQNLTSATAFGGMVLTVASMIPMTYHTIRHNRISDRTEIYEVRVMNEIAHSRDGEELSWVAEYIDPPTAD